MEKLRCTYCGGALWDRGDYYECESCRTKIKKSAMERLSDQDIFDLNAAKRLKDGFRFDEAETAYDEVLRRNPDCEEAAWGAFLAEYGIEYQVEEQKPTFHALSKVPSRKSRYYGALSSEHKAEIDRKIEPARLKIMRSVETLPTYKNLFLYTKMRNVAGLSTTDAQKSSDMLLKCRYIDEMTDSRGVVFATGTPVSNSMTELYTMMRYRVIARDVDCVPAALRQRQVILRSDYDFKGLVMNAVEEACATRQNAATDTPRNRRTHSNTAERTKYQEYPPAQGAIARRGLYQHPGLPSS